MATRDELHGAIIGGDAERVRALLQRAPEALAATPPDGAVSPLLTALYTRNRPVVEALLAAGAKPDVFEASALNDADALRALLAADPALVRAYSPDGWTALHLAGHFDSVGAAQALLERGADPSARSRNAMQNQPLHAAASGSASPELARLLLAAGAEVNATQRGGFTPLMSAAQNGSLPLVHHLLASGADPAARSAAGKTAADYASAEEREAVIAALSHHDR